MTLEKARQLIRELGWTPYLVNRGKYHYLVAVRKIPRKRKNLQRHIGPVRRLETVQPGDIKQKLAPRPNADRCGGTPQPANP